MNTNDIARIAGLVGEPARTAMLVALIEGRALTAGELARAAGITAATESRHLAQLVDGELVVVTRSGRHRYHRLASPEVARILEGIMQLASTTGRRRALPQTGPRAAPMRLARTCYDHLAGRLGVAITEHLTAAGAMELTLDSARPQPTLVAELARIQLSIASPMPTCRPCMDWSERRPHLAGPLATRLCRHLLERGWLQRPPAASERAGRLSSGRSLQARGLVVSVEGGRHLSQWLGAARWAVVLGQSPAGAGESGTFVESGESGIVATVLGTGA